MKNNLSELNNYLFECIERIQDDTLSEDGLDKEIKKVMKLSKYQKQLSIMQAYACKLKNIWMNTETAQTQICKFLALKREKKKEKERRYAKSKAAQIYRRRKTIF